MPINVIRPPMRIIGVGLSPSTRNARRDAPMGSPRRLMETTGASTYLRAQLYMVCPKIMGTTARARNSRCSSSGYGAMGVPVSIPPTDSTAADVMYIGVT